MNNVVKIWDVYENSHSWDLYDNSQPTGTVVHAEEELRLKNEVERLNSTIVALEAERDEHLRTIEALKCSRPKVYNAPRKALRTPIVEHKAPAKETMKGNKKVEIVTALRDAENKLVDIMREIKYPDSNNQIIKKCAHVLTKVEDSRHSMIWFD
jgi:hypothetical protein